MKKDSHILRTVLCRVTAVVVVVFVDIQKCSAAEADDDDDDTTRPQACWMYTYNTLMLSRPISTRPQLRVRATTTGLGG